MGAAALNHEVLDHPVEVQAVVVAHFNQFDKIGDGVGCTAVKEVNGDVSSACFHENLHGWTTKRHFKRICMPCPEAHLDIPVQGVRPMTSILDLPLATMNDGTTTLRELGGSRWLVVNVASACGATPQYAGLQALHEAHDDLTVVGFPCNQFGAQEPGTHAEICDFTASKFNVTFPLMAKVEVNGDGQTPLFSALCDVADADGYSGPVRWNFEKFLIDANGTAARYSTRVAPEQLPV